MGGRGGDSGGQMSIDKAAPGVPMSSKQEAALKYYQTQGYYEVNSQLRTGETYGEATEHKEAIDSLMSETKGEFEVYRGYNEMSRTADSFKDLEPGDQITDKGYTSTSANPAIADQFADEGTEWREYITVSKGTDVVNMNQQIYNKSFGKEQEILLHRDNTRTVTKVDVQNKIIYTRI
jgi:hypothetical protein